MMPSTRIDSVVVVGIRRRRRVRQTTSRAHNLDPGNACPSPNPRLRTEKLYLMLPGKFRSLHEWMHLPSGGLDWAGLILAPAIPGDRKIVCTSR